MALPRTKRKYENDDVTIWFKSNKGNGFAFLSNFWPDVSDVALKACPAWVKDAHSSFVLDGLEFRSVEHYFQASKYAEAPMIFEDIRSQATAIQAKKRNTYWKNINPIDVAKWDARKAEVMHKAVLAKFSQNVALGKALIYLTGNRRLCETPGRQIGTWQGGEGGDNTLGKILVTVRETLKQDSKFEDAELKAEAAQAPPNKKLWLLYL